MYISTVGTFLHIWCLLRISPWPMLWLIIGLPVRATPRQNMEAAYTVQQKDKMADGSGFPSPLPCVVAKLLIFEGKGFQIKIMVGEQWIKNSKLLLRLIRARKLLVSWIPFRIVIKPMWNFRVLYYYWCSVLPYKSLPVIKIPSQNQIQTITSTNTNFSFSPRVYKIIKKQFLQGLWKRANRNDSRTNCVFIFLHFSFLTVNQAWSVYSCKYFWGHFIYGSLCHGYEDVPWPWMRLFTLSKIWKIRGRRGVIF